MSSHKWLFAVNQGATFVAHRVQTVKDDKTEENTFEILKHSDRNINNS